MLELNETHAPTLSSWIESANLAGSDFPIQNLPFAVFRRAGSDEAFRGGVAIGSQIVDLALAAQCGALAPDAQSLAAACGEASQFWKEAGRNPPPRPTRRWTKIARASFWVLSS